MALVCPVDLADVTADRANVVALPLVLPAAEQTALVFIENMAGSVMGTIAAQRRVQSTNQLGHCRVPAPLTAAICHLNSA